MKLFKKYVIAFALSIFFIGGVAQTNDAPDDSSPNKGQTIIRNVSNKSNRKRIPSNEFIDVKYENGHILLTAEDEIPNLELSFNSTTGGFQIIPSITTGEYVPIELEIGQYELTAKETDGKIFYGIMIIKSF